MRAIRLLAIVLFIPCLAWAHGVSNRVATVTSNNSTLTIDIGPPDAVIQILSSLEWSVDGRRILVYSSSPLFSLDINHFHADTHVDSNQIHALGPLPGYDDKVVGGVVYTLDGGKDGSLSSRISEKLDIVNNTGTDLPLLLIGLGWKPTSPALEVPDLTGLNVTGTTVAFFVVGSIAEGAGKVTVLPIVSFSGFNPFNQQVTIPAGATLTMITELEVSRAPARPPRLNLPPNLRDDLDKLLRSPFSRLRF